MKRLDAEWERGFTQESRTKGFWKDLIRCDEILTRQLLALDVLELGSAKDLRTTRKILISEIEKSHAICDRLQKEAHACNL